MAAYRYVVVDVFTEVPLAGNQLAVFTDARGLEPQRMQALALEVGFSETAFVLPAAGEGHASIRIFTPRAELRFAGHPILGTAFVLAAPLQLGLIGLETASGVVPVELERDEWGGVAFGRMRQPVPTVAPAPSPDVLLGALGVERSAVRGVGIGFGGPVDDATKTVIRSHQIEGWDDFPLADWISDLLGWPAVLGNDADVAGLAEALFGAGKGLSPIFYITIGSGIGGGLIIDGEIYRGCGRGAAEIGHLEVLWRTPESPGFEPIDMRVQEMIMGARGDVVLKVFGDDIDELNRIAAEAAARIRALPGAADVFAMRNGGMKYLTVSIDRLKEIVPIWKKEFFEGGAIWIGDQAGRVGSWQESPPEDGEPERAARR